LKGHGFSRAVQVPQKSAGLYRLRKNSLIDMVLKGHGFSRAVQVPQKSAGLYRLRKNSLIDIVLKGHGFSRAVKLPGNRAALAAEGWFSPLSRDSFGPFSAHS
jgi:hypothetical protein